MIYKYRGMFALLGVGALLGGAAVLSAAEYDKRPGGRDSDYYRSRSIMLSSRITKSLDTLANLDARDNAHLYLKELTTHLANSLNDERAALMSANGNDNNAWQGMKGVLIKLTALLKATARLRFLSENELIAAACSHPMRVGDSPAGVAGVEGMELWLLGGMRAGIERQIELDANAEREIKSCMSRDHGPTDKAKDEALHKMLGIMPTPYFAPRFPFEAALLSLQHPGNEASTLRLRVSTSL